VFPLQCSPPCPSTFPLPGVMSATSPRQSTRTHDVRPPVGGNGCASSTKGKEQHADAAAGGNAAIDMSSTRCRACTLQDIAHGWQCWSCWGECPHLSQEMFRSGHVCDTCMRLYVVWRPPSVLVSVSTLGGERDQLILELQPNRIDLYLQELQEKIFRSWRVSPACQRLCLGVEPLQDSRQIYEIAMEAPVDVTLVIVSLDYVQANIAHLYRSESRCLLFDDIPRIKDPDAVDTVLAYTNDDIEPDVMSLALDMLMDVSEKGDPRVLACLCRHAHSEDDELRSLAVSALGTCAPKGDKNIIILLIASTKDNDYFVRYFALIALASIAERGDRDVLRAVQSYVQDILKDRMDCATIDVFGCIAQKGNLHALLFVTRYVEYPSSDVRRAALRALATLAEQADVDIMNLVHDAVCDRLADECPSVRTEAATALSAVAAFRDSFGYVSPVCLD